MERTGFRIILVDPETYYLKPQRIIELLNMPDVDTIQMQDPELIVGLGIKLRQHYGSKLIFHPHYSPGRVARSSHVTAARLELTERYERAAFHSADKVLCLAATDKNYFVDTYNVEPSKIIIYKPPAFDLSQKAISRPCSGRRIFYLGSLYFRPNVEAVENLISLYPSIKDHVDEVCIIGEKPPQLFGSLDIPAFKFLGKVDQLEPVLRHMNLGVFPINEGSGIRSKILCCFKAGIPVIGTPAAFQGLQGCERLTAHGTPSLTHKVVSILDGYHMQHEISRWEQDYMDKKFNVSEISHQLYTIYRQIDKLTSMPQAESLPHKEPYWLEEYRALNKKEAAISAVTLPLIIN